MKILTVSFILSLTIWISPAYSQSDQRDIPPAEIFTSALLKFKTKDYVQSRQLLQKLLLQNSSDPTLLYNMGLVEMADQHQERAFAYWRRALFLRPGHGPSLAGVSSLNPAVANFSWPLWLYWRIPISALFVLSFVFWCLCAALILRNLQKIKNQQPVRWFWAVGMSAGFVLCISLSTHYYLSLFQKTSASFLSQTPASAAPTSESPSLFEFKEGDDVTVLRSQNDWVQVKKSETAVGWVKKSSLLIYSGWMRSGSFWEKLRQP